MTLFRLILGPLPMCHVTLSGPPPSVTWQFTFFKNHSIFKTFCGEVSFKMDISADSLPSPRVICLHCRYPDPKVSRIIWMAPYMLSQSYQSLILLVIPILDFKLECFVPHENVWFMLLQAKPSIEMEKFSLTKRKRLVGLTSWQRWLNRTVKPQINGFISKQV